MRSEWRREVDEPLSGDDLAREDRECLIGAMREYFNLCSEELFLHHQGWIDDAAWEIWEQGMKDRKKEPYFVYSWERLRSECSYFPAFCTFMKKDLLS